MLVLPFMIILTQQLVYSSCTCDSCHCLSSHMKHILQLYELYVSKKIYKLYFCTFIFIIYFCLHDFFCLITLIRLSSVIYEETVCLNLQLFILFSSSINICLFLSSILPLSRSIFLSNLFLFFLLDVYFLLCLQFCYYSCGLHNRCILFFYS